MSCVHEYVPDSTEAYRLDATLNFLDSEYWPENQVVLIGLFDSEDSRTPVVSKEINIPSGSVASITLDDIPKGEYYLKLYLTEGGVFKSFIQDLSLISINSNTYTEPDDVLLLSYQRIQKQVFNGCQLCHGGSSGELAGGLDLTSDNSYNSLVNTQATNQPSLYRVSPGSAEFSYLISVLDEMVEFDHAASSAVTEDDRQLIVDWIENGALDN